MIAGLVFQVVSLAVFVALCADFGRKVLFSGADPRTALISFVCSKRRWYAFLIGTFQSHILALGRVVLLIAPSMLILRSIVSGNAHYFHPLLLPCCRIIRRVSRKARK